jgi:hypothetical protein
MRRTVLVIALLIAAPSVRAAAPPGAHATGSPDDLAFFERKVRPLLVNRCQNCHSTKAKKKRGGLLLDSRTALLAGGDSGPAVVPGQPGKSLLVQAVTYDHPTLHMPPAGKLPAQEVALLAEWVRRGAAFPGPAATAPAKGPLDLAAGKQFWSFRPLAPIALPPVRSSWARRPLDTFVLAEQQKHGLSPSPAASRRVLLRRLSFDLVGLPPTPEEVEAFVADERPDAYERLVDRLLASPQHGERWGRFWLDLARYADVTEPWSESKGAPWLYRDWVVRALNRDLPYDNFVKLQLAADLLPDSAPDDLAALGLLGLSPSYWKELKLDHVVIKGVVAEEWEERIHTLGSTFLGLTVACARCHDHKFDPITQADYYALAGVLASTRQADRPLLPRELAGPALAARRQVAALEAELRKLQSRKGDAKAQKRAQEVRVALDKARRTPGLSAPLAPAVEDASLFVLPDGPDRTRLDFRPGVAQDVAMQVRGNPGAAGAVVPRRFLAVLSPGEPRPFRSGSGRRELAEALVGEGGALAARVIVNRVWKHHFGDGLVRTPSDFGTQGERPSHPELLDWLAGQFIAHGWSLKWLHREIVLSATYRQASTLDPHKQALDPENRWLWRMARRRLEAEAWRDAMLAASGALRQEIGGPARDLGASDNGRRTLYGLVKRRELNDFLRLHDVPDPTTHSAARVPTITPLQQLFVLTSPFLRQQSGALARRLAEEAPGGAEARVAHAYRLLYQRAPTPTERELARAFLGDGRAGLWEQYAQVLLGSNELLFVD